MSSNSNNRRRAIYICPGWGVWSAVINELERNFSIIPVAVMSNNTEYMEKSITFKDCLVIDVKKLREGTASEEKNTYALDEKILKMIAPYKNITIKMMERYYFGDFNSNSSTQLMMYHKLVKDCYSIFLRMDPGIVIAQSQPHRVYDYLIKQFCLVHNIEFIAYEHTGIKFLSYFTSSFESNFPYRKKQGKNAPVSKELNAFIDKTNSNAYEDVKSNYTNNNFVTGKQNKKNYLFLFLKKLSKLRLSFFFKTTLGYLIVFFQDSDIHVKQGLKIGLLFAKIKKILSLHLICKPYYSFFSKKNIHNKLDYVYFSPNFQPERSTVPDGGVFWDFNSAIDILHSSLPKGWKILYKEHPAVFRGSTEWHLDRDIYFYRRLRLKYPNLLFVSMDEDVLNLIDSSKAVAAVSGTVVWESVIRGKPVLTFGSHCLENMPGVVKTNSQSDCFKIFNKIDLKIFKNVVKEDISDYFSNLECNCVDLSSYLDYMSVARSSGGSLSEIKNNDLINTDEIVHKLTQSIIAAIT